MSDFVHKTWIRVKSVQAQITLTRSTTTFFVFSCIFCLFQGLIQSFLYNADANAFSLIAGIVTVAEVPTTNIPWLTEPNGQYALRLCSDIPVSGRFDICVVAYEEGMDYAPNLTFPAGYRRSDTRSPLSTIDINHPSCYSDDSLILSATTNSDGDVNGVTITHETDRSSVFLDEQCTRVLVYPLEILNNSQREDLALVGFQFWLFSVSLFALVYGSIPHIIAVILSRTLAMAWSAYTLWRTGNIEMRFHRLVIDAQTPCHEDLFGSYFSDRLAWEIPDLTLNCLGLLITGYLGYQLIKTFSEGTFQRVGPPKGIVRIYMFFQVVLVCLQLSMYFLVTGMSLWVDNLLRSPLGIISEHNALYGGLLIFTTVTLFPWMYMGWFAVRREHKRLMIVFLIMCLIYVVGWSAIFDSEVYRWTFMQWPFFGCVTVTSLMVLVVCGAFGIICLLNFEKGLAHYLHVHDLLAETDFAPSVFVDFYNKRTRTPESTLYMNGSTRHLKGDKMWDLMGSGSSVKTDIKSESLTSPV